MKKANRLSGSNRISALFRRGRKINSPLFSCFFIKNDLGYVRLAVTVSKKNEKKATKRNKVRRQIREWARKHKFLSSYPLDLGIVVKKEAFSVVGKKLYAELETCSKILSTYLRN